MSVQEIIVIVSRKHHRTAAPGQAMQEKTISLGAQKRDFRDTDLSQYCNLELC